MDDLSRLAVNSITASSMAAGNMTSSNATAMTAPGTEPVDPLPDREQQGDPHLTPISHARTVIISGDNPQRYAPFGAPGAGGWSVASDDSGRVTEGWVTP
jgi:hypothetical protein